jgi:hypothetical protein
MIRKKLKLITVTVYITAFIIAVSVRGEQQTINNQSATTLESFMRNSVPDVNKTNDGIEEKPNKPQSVRNPFQYHIPQSGFLPTTRTAVPSGIELLAIIIVRNQTPLAVLKVPGMVDVYYVRAGDSISCESKLKSGKNEVLHLRIDSITSQQIVIHPEDNLEGKRVLR